jgi:3-oxoacyl-[acyl-carrier protein] reductase
MTSLDNRTASSFYPPNGGPTMTKPLQGKVAVVTGSGQGVGRGVAILLARAGAKVVTNGLRRPEGPAAKPEFRMSAASGAELTFTETESGRYTALSSDPDRTAEQIIGEGGEAVAFYADVSDFEASGALIQAALDTFGRIDILVNNAAGLGFGPFLDVTEADWKYQMAAKLNGSFNCMKHAVPHMIRQQRGRVLNAASDAWTGIAMLSHYSAANAGVVALTKATSKELACHGITVNAFCPQAASPAHVSFNATLRTMRERAGVPMNVDEDVMRSSEEAHGAAENLTFLAYLATDEAARINGAVFTVTAGGQIALYSDPTRVSEISKAGAPWTLDELRSAVPQTLLKDYVSVAEKPEF